MVATPMIMYLFHSFVNVVPALIVLVACGIFLFRHRCIESILLTIGATMKILGVLLAVSFTILIHSRSPATVSYQIYSYTNLALGVVGGLIFAVGLLLTVINRIRLPGESPAAVTKT